MINIDDFNARLETFPRHQILQGPTPLTRLDRLSDALGIDCWIKRDDLAGPSFGGNKSRQLEYYLGAALAEGADTILITGAVQSNFVRLAAAVAAAAGLKAVVQLEHRVDTEDPLYATSGNVLLNQLLGARIITYPVGEDEHGADDALYREAERLKDGGARPYVIPLGINKPPLGSLGYARCAQEIMEQHDQGFDEVVVGSGSAATHIGMMAGMKVFAPLTRVTGSCVRRDRVQQQERVGQMSALFNEMLGLPDLLTEADIHLWDGALAPGYGQLGPIAAQAMQQLARLEGQIVDPVYTAKVLAGVIARVASGEIAPGARVLFLHSGGLAAFFAYQNLLKDWV